MWRLATRQWSRVLPSGTRPAGRYGHSLNIIGSKIYIFGGQVEGFFMNDLCAFDLNQLQMANNRWEMLIPNGEAGPDPMPQARTNHTVVTHNDKLFLYVFTPMLSTMEKLVLTYLSQVWRYQRLSMVQRRMVLRSRGQQVESARLHRLYSSAPRRPRRMSGRRRHVRVWRPDGRRKRPR